MIPDLSLKPLIDQKMLEITLSVEGGWFFVYTGLFFPVVSDPNLEFYVLLSLITDKMNDMFIDFCVIIRLML